MFNRSQYEDVLVVRVHDLVPESEWSTRYDRINEFERRVVDAGTHLVKVMLHISKAEQKERLSERLADPTKHWKYNAGDLTERAFWDDYQAAYQDALTRCSTDAAPWYVVPARPQVVPRLGRGEPARRRDARDEPAVTRRPTSTWPSSGGCWPRLD